MEDLEDPLVTRRAGFASVLALGVVALAGLGLAAAISRTSTDRRAAPTTGGCDGRFARRVRPLDQAFAQLRARRAHGPQGTW
jgi:hypothetical protein